MSPEELIRASTDLHQPKVARRAMVEYLNEYPDGPAARDMMTSLDLLRALHAMAAAVHHEMPSWSMPAAERLIEHFTHPVSAVTCNGFITRVRIEDAAKRERLLEKARDIADTEAELVAGLFESAREQAESLLLDGEPRAVVDGVTLAEAGEQADVFYRAYQAGDLDSAQRGFEQMRNANPYDAYPRRMLGVIAEQQDRKQDALREYLWTLHLVPGDPIDTSNAMRFLLLLGLHPLAFEIAKHYARIGRSWENPVTHRLIVALGRWARPAVANLACGLAGFDKADVSDPAPDALDFLEPGARPWLTEPEPVGPSLLDKAEVFLSYRRQDAAACERLELGLKVRHPRMRVFRDLTRLKGADDFTEEIMKAIDSSNAVFVLIGAGWTGPNGARLRDPNDVLRKEVARALKQGRIVVPVLLENTPVPVAEELPKDVRRLVDFHAEHLRGDSFDFDVERLIAVLADALARAEQSADEFQAMMAHQEKLEQEDPAAARDFAERWLGRAKVELPQFESRKAPPGVGVPSSLISLPGAWECTALHGSQQQFVLRFTASDRPRSPVEGEWLRGRQSTRIQGRWITIRDPDQQKLLGMRLEVVEGSGAPREFEIPFQRLLGDVLVGMGPDGLYYTSRKQSE